MRSKNILLVDFLGLSIVDDKVNIMGVGTLSVGDENLFYKWELLMKVVDIIEDMGFDFKIENNLANVKMKSGKCIFSYESFDSKMNAVFNTLVGFIEWYNSKIE